MVINNCKHDGGWYLIYCAGVDHYVYRCDRCMVYKMNFSCEEAGKIRTTVWAEEIISYYKPSHSKEIILSKEGKF